MHKNNMQKIFVRNHNNYLIIHIINKYLRLQVLPTIAGVSASKIDIYDFSSNYQILGSSFKGNCVKMNLKLYDSVKLF